MDDNTRLEDNTKSAVCATHNGIDAKSSPGTQKSIFAKDGSAGQTAGLYGKFSTLDFRFSENITEN